MLRFLQIPTTQYSVYPVLCSKKCTIYCLFISLNKWPITMTYTRNILFIKYYNKSRQICRGSNIILHTNRNISSSLCFTNFLMLLTSNLIVIYIVSSYYVPKPIMYKVYLNLSNKKKFLPETIENYEGCDNSVASLLSQSLERPFHNISH